MTSINYTSIPPGEYVLKIVAKNRFNQLTVNPYEIRITVIPPFWKTKLFYFSVISFILFIFFIYVRIREKSLRTKKNILEKIVNERTQEVVHQKNIIEEKQKEIIDSINYARRIQNTILAPHEFLEANLPNHFVYYNPKDIVSGDFYWAAKRNETFYLAICDSTGHGIPGAFMSLLNIGFLSEAIIEKGIEKPNEIFNYVRQQLIDNINKDGQRDGFDGILACFNQERKQITYAAANCAPLLIRNNQLIEQKEDRMPVGIGERKEDFKLYTIDVEVGDRIYFYTDGYADQFGGTRGKKFKYRQLNDLLLANNLKSLDEQKNILMETFESWRGNLEQVDDVCIIGIQI
jgi:serine phosphatase RsbU (regulator of sigma subunit)